MPYRSMRTFDFSADETAENFLECSHNSEKTARNHCVGTTTIANRTNTKSEEDGNYFTRCILF